MSAVPDFRGAVTTARSTSTGIRGWRIALVVLGLALIALGGVVLLALVAPSNYIGILVWFAAALIVHDGIIAPLTFGVAVLLRRRGRRMPGAVIAIVQGALVVGGIIAVLVVPEIYKKSLGSRNPTVLPLDYGANLLWFYLALAVVTGVAIMSYLRVARSRRSA